MLGRQGRRVMVLEGRERVGGRIHTVSTRIGGLPIEAGAEFVHGSKNQTWHTIRTVGLHTQEVPDRHWQYRAGQLVEDQKAWEELELVFSRIDAGTADSDFESFLRTAKGVNDSAKVFAREYVEGFHAADARRVSVHSLAQAETAAEAEEGDRQFRLLGGYAALLEWFKEQLLSLKVETRLGTVVDSLSWKSGNVQLEAHTSAGRERFQASQVLVTVPLGVLQTEGAGGLTFVPRLQDDKQQAIRQLAMGSVVKIAFQFRDRFWPVENFGFIHANGGAFPTWWSDERGPLLTGWVGGPRAQALNEKGQESVVAKGLQELSEIFDKPAREIEELLIGVCHHNWSADPFSRGAYSYTPVGMSQMIDKLAAPIEDTLFFAGEATDANGDQGTVHGALASGRRAAEEILAAGKARSKPRGASARPAGAPQS